MSTSTHSPLESKIKTSQQLKALVPRLKKKGTSIAFTNGCFDILHYGHVRYLEEAKQLADILVVGVNSDASVKKIKGENRPIHSQENRLRVLAALASVDYVALFNEATPLKLITMISPDVLVKGGDWSIEKIVGADFVKSYGGKVAAIPYVKGHSTSSIIERIQRG